MLRKRGDMIYKTLLFRQFCVISVKVWNCLEDQILVEIFSNLSYLKTRIIHSSQIIFKVTQNLATKNVVLKWLRFCCYDYKTILFFSADVMKNHVVVSQVHNGYVSMLMESLISIITCLMETSTICRAWRVGCNVGGGLHLTYLIRLFYEVRLS